MIIAIPELAVPLPSSFTPEEAKSLHEKAHAAFKTVEFLQENGMDDPLPTEADKKEARAVFFDTPSADPEIKTSGKAVMLKSLLSEYDLEIVRNAAQLRGYIKLKLLELSDQGKESTQLKALELLGKMSDVQAFAEHVEINVTHKTTEELQQTLAQKLSAYMKDIVDVEARSLDNPETAERRLIGGAPAVQVIDLDEELGRVGGEVTDLDAELGKTGGENEPGPDKIEYPEEFDDE